MRLPTSGGVYVWLFTKQGQTVRVRDEAPLTFKTITLLVEIVVADLGLAFLPRDIVRDRIADGRLVRVMADWSPSMPRYHLYYPSRRQPTPAFAMPVGALRYRG